MTRRWTKWVPALAIPAVVIVGAVMVPLQAGAAGDLPDKTPQQLLEFAASSNVDALSGTLEQTSNLGLPDLSSLTSSMGGSGASGASGEDVSQAIDLVTGSHTARVFIDGSDARMQVMDQLAERDIVASPDGVWFYDSDKQSAVHLTGSAQKESADVTAPTPQTIANSVLGKIGDTARVTVGKDGSVAGRPAYKLVVTPKDADTLIGSISLSIDADTGLALAAQVNAKGSSDPAFKLAFTQVTLAAPDASLFDFTPPAGTDVTEKALPASGGLGEHVKDERAAGIATVGTGWSTVAVVPAAQVPADALSSPMLKSVTTAVTGGRLISTALVNVLIADDGRVLVGSVTPDRLLAAAAGS